MNMFLSSRHWRSMVVIVSAFLITSLACPANAEARHKKRYYRQALPSALSALLLDSTTNTVLFEKNSQRPIYPASTTKVMTALLVLEKLPLDSMVTVSPTAIDVQETKLNLKPGEQYRVRDLLFAILLKSANDAANVLAEAVGGTQNAFVAMMNAKAKQLGATRTCFANANGLPSASVQYTTAKDMAIILREALKNPVFNRIITYKYRIIYAKDGRRHFLKSHNRALFMNWKRDVYGKTGFTLQAQQCFIGYIPKEGHVLIIAVFDSRKRWEDVKYLIQRYGKVSL